LELVYKFDPVVRGLAVAASVVIAYSLRWSILLGTRGVRICGNAKRMSRLRWNILLLRAGAAGQSRIRRLLRANVLVVVHNHRRVVVLVTRASRATRATEAAQAARQDAQQQHPHNRKKCERAEVSNSAADAIAGTPVEAKA
jgi:hypothetical protein